MNLITEQYEVQVCYKKQVIWEGVVTANNTVDAQQQGIQATNIGFGMAMYDYINVDAATTDSVWTKLNN